MHLSLLTYWMVDFLRVGAMMTSLSFLELNMEVHLVNTSKWRILRFFFLRFCECPRHLPLPEVWLHQQPDDFLHRPGPPTAHSRVLVYGS